MKDLFIENCARINDRLHRLPGKAATLRMVHDTFGANLISRMYRGRQVYYCSECGCEINDIAPLESKGHRCPHCHTKWTDIPELQVNNQKAYYMVLEAKGDVQLSRVYRVERTTKFHKPASYHAFEVERFFYAPDGRREIYTLSVFSETYYYDCFIERSEMNRKEEHARTYRTENRYNLGMMNYHIKSLTERWRHKDIPSLLNKYDMRQNVLAVIAYPWCETLRETGEDKLFDFLVGNAYSLSWYAEVLGHAATICHRHGYHISDPSMWVDHIKMLKEMGYDTHNPKFVCPANLRKAHQELIDKKQREYLRKQEEEHRREIARREREFAQELATDKQLAKKVENYPKHMGQILSLDLQGENLSIRPLQSVKEFEEEGVEMDHCVFMNRYWDYKSHPNTLILSAKDGMGKRLATIEYNTASNTIVQCRAFRNGVPKREAEIRQLITDNKAKFVRLERATRKAKAA